MVLNFYRSDTARFILTIYEHEGRYRKRWEKVETQKKYYLSILKSNVNKNIFGGFGGN